MPLFINILLLLLIACNGIGIFYMTRWGIGMWEDLNAGKNGDTAAMMAFFFSLAAYYVMVLVNLVLQLSFVPFHEPAIVATGRLFHLATFIIWLFICWLMDRRFRD